MKQLILVFLLGTSFLSLEGCKDSKEDAIDPGVKLETFFDAAYVASNGFQEAGKTNSIADGKPVWVLKDLIGDKDLIWAGGRTVQSTMWPALPNYYTDEAGGYIFLPNLNYSYWISKQFAELPQPIDFYFVVRDIEAVKDEGYFAVSVGVRTLSSNQLEFSTGLYPAGSPSAVNMDAGVVPEFNKPSIIRIRLDGNNTALWINDVQVTYKGAKSVNLGNGAIRYLGYGSVSHVEQHDFYSMWVKFGKLTDEEHRYVYDKLAKQYNVGAFPSQPFANKIRVNRNNGTDPNRIFTADYEYTSTTGTAEEKTKTQYQWGFLDNSSASDVNLARIIPGATGKTMLRSDYPTFFKNPGQGKYAVFVSVKVFDTKGNSWTHYTRSPVVSDNF